MTFKPMLSGKAPADLTKLTYPVLASPKLDGIRCIIRDGLALSRNLKPIPNERVREALEGLPDGVDGELMVEGGFNACQSFFMSREPSEWTNDWWLFAFDWIRSLTAEQLPFQNRLAHLTCWSENNGHNNLHVVQHVLIANSEQLLAYDAENVARGFEGTMVRDPEGPYKFGRSTAREGYLLKIKQFEDEEAVVVDAVERMHNENELEQDALGHAKRSHAKAGMVPAGDLGALVCRTADGAEFQIGSGFTADQRSMYWELHRRFGDVAGVTGRTVTFKHQPPPGGRQPGQAPRFPVFKGFRNAGDMS